MLKKIPQLIIGLGGLLGLALLMVTALSLREPFLALLAAALQSLTLLILVATSIAAIALTVLAYYYTRSRAMTLALAARETAAKVSLAEAQAAKAWAEAQAAEINGHVKQTILKPGERLFEATMHQGQLYSHARSRDPRFYANGPATVTPSTAEAATWIAELKAITSPKTAARLEESPHALQPGQVTSHTQDLLAALDEAQRILIVGGSGTGKTTLLCHLIDRRTGAAEVMLLDPHATPRKWPPQAKIIGMGREYGKIEAAMGWLNEQLTARYDDLAKGLFGEREHPQILAASDEFTVFNEHFDVGDYLSPLLTEGRKVALDLIIASHSDRASVLGLKGRYDLKESFDCVVYLEKKNQRHRAKVQWGKDSDKVEYRLPGPYKPTPSQPLPLSDTDSDTIAKAEPELEPAKAPPPLEDVLAEASPFIAEDDPTDILTPGQRRLVIEAYQADPSLSRAKLCEAAVGYKTGRLYPAIEAIIAECEAELQVGN